jgi:hypothetical protein
MHGTLILGTPSVADDLRLTPQARKVLAHLNSGKTITPLKASKVYDIDRLADVIWKIKRVGYRIETTLHTDESGKRYAEYRRA